MTPHSPTFIVGEALLMVCRLPEDSTNPDGSMLNASMISVTIDDWTVPREHIQEVDDRTAVMAPVVSEERMEIDDEICCKVPDGRCVGSCSGLVMGCK